MRYHLYQKNFDDIYREKERYWNVEKLRLIVDRDNEKCPENLCDPESKNDCTVYLPECSCGSLAIVESLLQDQRVRGHVGFDRAYRVTHGEDVSYKKARTRTWSDKKPYWFSRGESTTPTRRQFEFNLRHLAHASYNGSYYHGGVLQHVVNANVTGGTVLGERPVQVVPYRQTEDEVEYEIFLRGKESVLTSATKQDYNEYDDIIRFVHTLKREGPYPLTVPGIKYRHPSSYMVQDSDSDSISTKATPPVVQELRRRHNPPRFAPPVRQLEVPTHRHPAAVLKARKRKSVQVLLDPARPVLKARKRKATQLVLNPTRASIIKKEVTVKPDYSSSTSSSVARVPKRKIEYSETIPGKIPQVKKSEDDRKPAARKEQRK
jgi:hypothetical protein